jgi:hypothetical protein
MVDERDLKKPGEKQGNVTTKTPEEAAAEYVDSLRDRNPTTEQSAREFAGHFTRRPDDNRASEDGDEGDTDVGVWDTPNALPKNERGERHRPYDPSFRGTGENKIQGEEVPTTGGPRDRRDEETHL